MIKLSKRINFKSERCHSSDLPLKKSLSSTLWIFIRFVSQKSKRKTSIGPAYTATAKNCTMKITAIKLSAVKLTSCSTKNILQWKKSDRSKSNICKMNLMRSVKRSKRKKHKSHVWHKWGISFTMKLKNWGKNWQGAGTKVTTWDGKSTIREEHILSTQTITRFWTVQMLLMRTTCCWKNKWETCLEDLTRFSWLYCPKANMQVSNCLPKPKDSKTQSLSRKRW